MLPLATDVAREEGLHERSSYLITPTTCRRAKARGHYQRMACAVYTVRNYKISNAHLAANAALRMACAVEDVRNYKISNAPLAANAALRMAYAI